MSIITNADDRYSSDLYTSDLDILAIIFNYHKKDGDLLEDPNHLLLPPKLIFFCRRAMFGATINEFNQPTDFLGYHYFKLIFINPSSYSFNIHPNRGKKFDEVPIKDNDVYYNFSVPFTYEMVEIQINDYHSQWKIFFDKRTMETEYIRICADKLEIEDLNLEDHPDLDKFII